MSARPQRQPAPVVAPGAAASGDGGTAFPRRVRPYEKTQQPTPRWLRLVLGRDLAPTRAEYAAACAALNDGDPAADALVDWMYAFGPREARALFERALVQGVPADAPEPLKAFFRSVERTPAWVDHDAIADGVQFIHRIGESAAYVLRDLALMGGYLLSGFNQALVMTGALNKGTARRIAETGQWWMDCTEPGGLARFGAGFRSTMHVRLVHAMVRRHLVGHAEWDGARWGLPLNQIDMAATYLGFSVVMLGGLRKIGIPVTPRESRGVMQLWSYACWLMGVDEKWLRLSEREGVVLLHHTMMTQSPPDWTSSELGHALSREPLERHFDRFEALRRQLAYHQHLSVSQYFLGRERMQQLGLPGDVSAWYPLLTLLPRFAGYSAQRLLPGVNRLQPARGRAAQKAMLASMFGESEHGVIKPAQGHPAHV